jgi:hypothetical protein
LSYLYLLPQISQNLKILKNITQKIVTKLSPTNMDLGTGKNQFRIPGSKRHRIPDRNTVGHNVFANLDGMLGLQRAVGIEVGVRPGVGVHPDGSGTQ